MSSPLRYHQVRHHILSQHSAAPTLLSESVTEHPSLKQGRNVSSATFRWDALHVCQVHVLCSSVQVHCFCISCPDNLATVRRDPGLSHCYCIATSPPQLCQCFVFAGTKMLGTHIIISSFFSFSTPTMGCDSSHKNVCPSINTELT